MRHKNPHSLVPFEPISEDDIRDYAYHLYVQSGCIPGRDLDHWLEAKACLNACIPKAESTPACIAIPKERSSRKRPPKASPRDPSRQ